MVYAWRAGSRQPGNAGVVGARLEYIREQSGGRIAARDVVVDARNDESPLHRYFEWRDNVAALKYREGQARDLIRSVVVHYDEKPDTPVPAFVCVGSSDDEFGPYQATRIALTQETSREYVLSQALKELESWRRKYQHLQELASVLCCIDAALPVEKAA